jgi:integrase
MAKANRLIDSQVRALRAESKDRWENDGNGLYIRVRPNGTKSWVLRRNVNKRTKKTTLGVYPKMGLAKARIEAAMLRGKDAETADLPAAIADAPTLFGELLDRYYEKHIEPTYRRPRQVRQYIDNRVTDDIKALQVSDLSEKQTRDFRVTIHTWLEKYGESRGKVAANRLLAIFKQATKYGTAIGYLTVDPLRELTRKLVGGEETPGQRVLTDDEIRLLWQAESDHAPLLQFLLLTGQRIGEAQAALWTDVKDGKWYIPAENSKNKKAHWVPVTPAMQSILDSLPKDRRRIFKSISATATQGWLRRWCDRNKIQDRFTPHDLRRTYVTRMNDSKDLKVEPYVVEKLVNHSMSGVMAVYNHAEYEEQRMEAAEKWSRYVLALIEGEQ